MREEDESYARDVLIHQVKTGSVQDGYVPVELMTDRGEVACRFYPVEGMSSGVIWVGGIGGDWDSPARGLYPKLAAELRGDDISSLRVHYRYSRMLDEAVYDVLVGVTYLESRGISNMALVGHSFGGAAVIQAAALSESVRTVVALATQSYGAGAITEFCPDYSILLIHGAEDTVLPSYSSRQVYEMAHEPKGLIILEGNGHTLDESAQEVERIVHNWIVSELP